jgi:hypothetical protein
MATNRCESCPDHPDRVFCPVCGRADQEALHSVRLAGFVGVLHSTSPKIEEFWQTGDPSVFDQPA